MMQFVLNGLVLASTIALGAVGLSMTYNILRFANFAHGEVIAIGAYFSLAVVTLIGAGVGSIGPIAFGWPLLVSLPISIFVTSMIILLVDALVFRQLRNKNATRITLIMAAFGLSLMGRSLITLFAGGDPKYYEFSIRKVFELFPGAKIGPDELAVMGIAASAFIGLYFYLSRTIMGKSMRAVAENPVLARINGIDTRQVIRWTWIIGTAFATVGGTFLGHIEQLRPEMGFDLLLLMFAALILGGAGNLYGTVLGAILVGLIDSMSVAIGLSAYRAAVVFMVIMLILLVRPQGLLGEKA
ncbi:MAG: branched-chain amino acid ABC transporter permease [Proteobacteria bacterium]|nr:branched-chain amino acid ABC transporter permease [Pseudomonadota bacterium]MCH8187743.1 branched-chain amino acid ABC transporter permease [Pseudomonadota bacterium]